MESPKFRNKISLSAKGNSALKDILTPTSVGVEVESIESIIAPLHNTKVVIKTDLRKAGQTVTESERYSRRVITYNRVDINTILPEGYTPSSTVIATEVEKLNSLHSCDFTEDDILIEGGKIVANPSSLGYRNAVVVNPPGGAGQKMDQLKFDAFFQIIPANKTWLAYEDTAEINVVVNGVANTKTVTWNPTITPHVSLILELIEWVKQCATVDFDLNRVLNYVGAVVNDGGAREAYPVSGGNFTIKNLGSTPVDIGISIKYKNINNSYFEHITVLPYMRLAAIGATKAFADNLPHILKIDLPPSLFFEDGLSEVDDVDYTKFKVNGLTVGLFADANRLFNGHSDEYGQYSTFDSALWNFCKDNLIFTNRYGWWSKDGFYRCFIENISEQPLTIEIAGVEYQLGANPLKQQNNIFRKFINTNDMPVGGGGIIGASVTLNGTEYAIEQTVLGFKYRDFGSAIDELIKANPVINTLVDLQMGYIPYRGIVELYIENKAVLPTVISVSIKDQNDGFVEYLSPVTIAEAGSVGTPWNREELYTPKNVTGDNVDPSTGAIMVNGVLYPIQTDPPDGFSEYAKGIRRTPDNLYIYEWPMGLVMSSPQQVGIGQTLPPSLFPPPLYVVPSIP